MLGRSVVQASKLLRVVIKGGLGGGGMFRLAEGTSCPRCRKTQMNRIHRKPWMRFIPGSLHYRCPACRGKFFFVFGLIPLQTK